MDPEVSMAKAKSTTVAPATVLHTISASVRFVKRDKRTQTNNHTRPWTERMFIVTVSI